MTKRLAWSLTVVLVLASTTWLAAVSAQKPASADALLGQALHQEQSEGRLEDAIATYRKVLAVPDATRAQKARAQFQIGACYERLGLGEARKAYESVVSDYGDQGDFAAQAKARLSALGQPGTTAAAGLQSRRLDLPGGRESSYGYFSAITPDARLLAFTRGAGVWVRDLRAGTERQIGAPVGLAKRYGAIISPDGRLVAYLVSHNIGPNPDVDLRQEVQVFGVDGSNPRLVKALADREMVDTFCWSPDATRILMGVMYDNLNRGRVDVVRVSDGQTTLLADRAWNASGFSPDGRWVIFAGDDDHPQRPEGLYAIRSEGGKEVLLAPGAAVSVRGPVWTPDSTRVFYSSRRPDQAWSRNFLSDLYSVRVSDVAERSEVVAKDVVWPFNMLGVTRDGEVYQRREDTVRRLYEVEIDPRTGARLAAPRPIPTPRNALSGAWSPDGKALAYWSQSAGGTYQQPWELMIMPTSGAPSRVVWKEASSGPGVANKLIQWFPDGRNLLLHTQGGELFRLSAFVGVTQRLLESVSIRFSAPQNSSSMPAVLSRDGRVVYYASADQQKKQVRILRRDLAGGAEAEVCTLAADALQHFALSPDGTRLAVTLHFGARVTDPGTYRTIVIVPAAGGAPVEIARPKLIVRQVMWSADGKRLFLLNRPPADTLVGDVFTMPADGGEPQPLGIGLHDLYFLNISPDGRRLILTDVEVQNDIWVTRFPPLPATPAAVKK